MFEGAVHVPWLAVSVCPSRAVPEIAGSTVARTAVVTVSTVWAELVECVESPP